MTMIPQRSFFFAPHPHHPSVTDHHSFILSLPLRPFFSSVLVSVEGVFPGMSLIGVFVLGLFAGCRLGSV